MSRAGQGFDPELAKRGRVSLVVKISKFVPGVIGRKSVAPDHSGTS